MAAMMDSERGGGGFGEGRGGGRRRRWGGTGRNWVNIVPAGDRPVPVDGRSLIKVSRIDGVATTYQAAVGHHTVSGALLKHCLLAMCEFFHRVLGVDNELWDLIVVINLLLFAGKTPRKEFVFSRVASPGW